jgi:hypothetical protein
LAASALLIFLGFGCREQVPSGSKIGGKSNYQSFGQKIENLQGDLKLLEILYHLDLINSPEWSAAEDLTMEGSGDLGRVRTVVHLDAESNALILYGISDLSGEGDGNYEVKGIEVVSGDMSTVYEKNDVGGFNKKLQGIYQK